MNKSFVLALLATLSFGQSDQAELALLNYAANFGKTYKSVGEMRQRAANYQASLRARPQLEAESPFAVFGDTKFSDWSVAEFDAFLTERKEDRRALASPPPASEERNLQSSLADIDWVSVMGPVKDQGGCGSCAAFAVTSLLEGMQVIKTGNAPLHLSEQQGLDCARVAPYYNSGCSGGLRDSYMHFYSDNGAMLTSDYPYTGTDKACTQTSSSPIAVWGDWSSFVDLATSNGASIADLHANLLNGPIAVGVNASGWGSQYVSGIASPSDLSCDPLRINHGVVAVGYSAEVTGSPTTTTTTTSSFSDCTKASKTEKRSNTCTGANEVIYNRRYCCVETTTTTTTTTPGGVITPAYWLIQNSWGVGYGESGFMKLRADSGYGVCGVNRRAYAIDVL